MYRVRNLSQVLAEVNDNVQSQALDENQGSRLKDVLQGCENVLRDLDKTLCKYEELIPDTKQTANYSTTAADAKKRTIIDSARRAWKRLKFEPDDIKELRDRITSNVSTLNSLIEQQTL